MDNIKYLKQGELAIVSGDYKVFTLLGSCVAVVLWDEMLKIGGVNHYMLPTWPQKGIPDVRYGDVAITELHDKIILAGAMKRRLVAKVFGGASLLNLDSAGFNVGTRNVEVAKQMLSQLNVRIVEEKTGGKFGTKILFDVQTGYVKLDYIQNVKF